MSFQESTEGDETVALTGTPRLLEMLKYKRPHASVTEYQFIHEFLTPYKPKRLIITDKGAQITGALYIVVDPPPGSESPVNPHELMFSAHTDTVHWSSGKQEICCDLELGLVYKDDNECLGADNGAGVWLLLEMIDAGIPGTYVFHRGEEKGGIGSSGVSREHDDWVSRFKWAIAFDRRGTDSVITHQRCGTRGCSQTFAEELCSRLNTRGMAYEPDSTGSFTDTANYFEQISECTNVSVGYDHEHSKSETLDLNHLSALRDVVCDPTLWENLPAVRDPAVYEKQAGGWWSGSRRMTGAHFSGYGFDDDEESTLSSNVHPLPTKYTGGATRITSANDGEEYDGPGLADLTAYDIVDMTYTDIEDAVFNTADYSDIVDLIWELRYHVKNSLTPLAPSEGTDS